MRGDFSEKIDIKNTDQILNYGSAAQKNISEFPTPLSAASKPRISAKCGDMLGSL
ncbi:MAG: hypothetical protein V8T45_11095 [Oscillospiraceae bacterium]